MGRVDGTCCVGVPFCAAFGAAFGADGYEPEALDDPFVGRAVVVVAVLVEFVFCPLAASGDIGVAAVVVDDEGVSFGALVAFSAPVASIGLKEKFSKYITNRTSKFHVGYNVRT